MGINLNVGIFSEVQCVCLDSTCHDLPTGDEYANVRALNVLLDGDRGMLKIVQVLFAQVLVGEYPRVGATLDGLEYTLTGRAGKTLEFVAGIGQQRARDNDRRFEIKRTYLGQLHGLDLVKAPGSVRIDPLSGQGEEHRLYEAAGIVFGDEGLFIVRQDRCPHAGELAPVDAVYIVPVEYLPVGEFDPCRVGLRTVTERKVRGILRGVQNPNDMPLVSEQIPDVQRVLVVRFRQNEHKSLSVHQPSSPIAIVVAIGLSRFLGG